MAGPDDRTDRFRNIIALWRFFLSRNRIQALAGPHVELFSKFSHFVDQQLQKCLSVLLHLTLDRLLGEETFPALELAELLRGRRLGVREVGRPQLVADLTLHRLHYRLILFMGALPSGRLEFVCVERVDLAEWVECRVDLQAFPFVRGQQAEELIVLRAQFEDDTDSNDHVLEVVVIERLAVPLVRLILSLPKLSRHLGSAVLPASANAHALVELDAHF